MSEFDLLRIIYLLTALGLILGTWRFHQLGGKRTAVLVLIWICIFMVAAGIAAYIDEWAHPAPVTPPFSGDGSDFT